MVVIVCALPCYRGFINVHTGITRNESFVSSGHAPSWSRLLKSSVSVSASTDSDEKEGAVTRHSSKDGSLPIPPHIYLKVNKQRYQWTWKEIHIILLPIVKSMGRLDLSHLCIPLFVLARERRLYY